nr:hypothetical protein [Corynebacterium resistens]
MHRNIYYRDPSTKCAGNTGYCPFTTNTEGVRDDKVDRAEFQANYLGAALLIPRIPFSHAYHALVPDSLDDLPSGRRRLSLANLPIPSRPRCLQPVFGSRTSGLPHRNISDELEALFTHDVRRLANK